jgi:hypothetical protein
MSEGTSFKMGKQRAIVKVSDKWGPEAKPQVSNGNGGLEARRVDSCCSPETFSEHVPAFVLVELALELATNQKFASADRGDGNHAGVE